MIQNKALENQMDFLLSAALQKCGNIYDAEDLAQETLLAALSYLSKGNVIEDERSWLLTVMNRRFSDMLRKKYRQPTILMDCGFEQICETAEEHAAESEEEACGVRQAVAYLAKTYREVIVRFYMDGQPTAKIAAALGIPEGTVKSRLYLGRKRIRKGMDDMERYTKQSYAPVKLTVSCSGMNGRAGEPSTLVDGDLAVQNILWLAYQKPLTIEEISQAIGIPAAYVEPDIKKLVDGELMRQTGTRYYTDFMISTVEDQEKYVPAQKQLVQEHFRLFWDAVEEGGKQLSDTDFYKALSPDEKNSLELYFAFHCLDYGIYKAFSEIFDTGQNFPDRPDGGRWIAFGKVYFSEFHPNEHIDLMAHAYAGERHEYLQHFAGSKLAALHAYSASGFPARSYDLSPEYPFFLGNENFDAVLTKLLCLLKTDTDPEAVGFNTEYLKAIPWLVDCKILRQEGTKPVTNIPVLNSAQANVLWDICKQAREALAEDVRDLLAKFLQGKKQKIPAHLDSVPLQKQYLYADNALLFATVREAMKRGKLYDGGYDEAKEQPPCPMVFVWDPA